MGKKLVINNKDEADNIKLRNLNDIEPEAYDSIYLCGQGKEHEENETEKDEFIILDSRRIVRFLVCLNTNSKKDNSQKNLI